MVPDKFRNKVMEQVKRAVVRQLSFPLGHFPDRIRTSRRNYLVT